MNTESINNTQTTENPDNKVETKTADNQAEKLFTQEECQREIDRAVKKATAKYYKKLEKYEADAEDTKINKEIRKLVAEGMNFDGDGETLLKKLGDHYGKNGQQILDDYKNGDVSKREAEIKLEVLEFLNDEETSDEDIIAEYEEMSNKPKSKLTKTDRIRMEMMSKRYFKIISRKSVNSAEQWYKKNVGDDFDKLVGSEDFREFISDLHIPLDDAVKKYCKIKGVKKEDTKTEDKPYSPGSAKNWGGGNNPKFFTEEQVAKMSREEIRENFDAIIESEKHWRKKG